MDLGLDRPDGLEDGSWDELASCAERLRRAVDAGDRAHAVGAAKELVEATARVVLDAKGQPVGSNTDYEKAVKGAHQALDRRAGSGLSTEPPLRTIAQSAMQMALQLRDLRNEYGTGHGRARLVEVAEEIELVCIDAATLWTRWALRRLAHLIAGEARGIIHDLGSGTLFHRNELAERLKSAGLPTMETSDQRGVGVAVAHRAMAGTFMVRIDGIEACADATDPREWPDSYRAGVVEGLFLDPDGRIEANRQGVSLAAQVLAGHSDAEELLNELTAKIDRASESARFANDDENRMLVTSEMARAARVLPTEAAQQLWTGIAEQLARP